MLRPEQTGRSAFVEEVARLVLKSELAVRYLGTEGRIIEQLKTDVQFQTALDIIENSSVYDKLLNLN